MSEVESAATELKTQYAAQVAGDLERNIREQERIGAEVAALEERLRALRHDQTLLAELQRALGGDGPAPAGADTAEDTAKSAAPAPSVPRQASAATTANKRRKADTTKAAAAKKATTRTAAKSAATGTAAKSTATKPATTKSAAGATASEPADPVASAGSASSTASAAPADSKAAASEPAVKAGAPKPAAGSAAAGSASGKPTLVELIREHLGRQSEPRSSAEIATALAEAHPEREIKPKVVRTTVEGLVAKGQVQRTKQGSSVFYTASGSTPAPADAAAGAAAEQAPETA